MREATYPLLLPGPSNSVLGLAGGGVCPAGAVTGAAVRSCRTISPLPVPRGVVGAIGCVFSVALSRGLPRVVVNHHRYPVLLGLSSPAASLLRSKTAGATARPTLLIDYRLLIIVRPLSTTEYYSKSSLYFPRTVSICFLKRSSLASGKSFLKCTPRLSWRI